MTLPEFHYRNPVVRLTLYDTQAGVNTDVHRRSLPVRRRARLWRVPQKWVVGPPGQPDVAGDADGVVEEHEEESDCGGSHAESPQQLFEHEAFHLSQKVGFDWVWQKWAEEPVDWIEGEGGGEGEKKIVRGRGEGEKW